MSFHSWLHNLRSDLAPRRGQRHHRQSVAGGLRAATHRPYLEALEDRTLPSFSAPVGYATGPAPLAVVTADFNGDGRLDLAVANNGSNDVSILLGNGDGTFQAARNFATGAYPRSLAVGDFNGDGKLDLVTANGYDMSVLPGNGDGTFQPASDFGIGSDNPLSVAVGDFNGDGKLDLGVTSNLYVIDGFDTYGYPYGHNEGHANVLLATATGPLGPRAPPYSTALIRFPSP